MEKFELSFNNKIITIEVGEVAKQANGSVLIRFNNTVVLSTVCCSKLPKDDDFLSLVVDYEEKQYAIGKIPNNFNRREKKNDEHKVLLARLIDRSIRPMFDKGFKNEIQVINTVMSYDNNASIDVASLFGTSLALCISDIPFNGPIAGVRVARINKELIVNPSFEQQKKSDLDLLVAGNMEVINMIEAGASQISEKEMLDALIFAHQEIKKLCLFQKEVVLKIGKKKKNFLFYSQDKKIREDIFLKIDKKIKNLFLIKDPLKQQEMINKLKETIFNEYENKFYKSEKEKNNILFMVYDILESIIADEIRELVFNKKIRLDGRKIDEIRPLSAKVDFLPCTHGSVLFTRGQTQVISTTTLGILNDKQTICDLNGEHSQYFFHHYNFPPYSVGEIGKIGLPGRREIGHGKLCEKALSYVMPDINEFPYAIRLVSDVTESNGSSSQASICAGCLSLMSAGVPLKEIVSGISIGLITKKDLNNKNSYMLLTDIQGIEDSFGDMDFKISGTKNGITALQLDTKIQGINYEIIKKSLMQAKKARKEIRLFMESILKKPRKEVNKHALKMKKIKIDINKISDLVGFNGKNINNIIDQCNNCNINIANNGEITIYHNDINMLNKAIDMIKKINRNIQIGDIFTGIVKRIENYGVFVNLYGSTDGLCHIKYMNIKLFNNIKIGDKLKVKVIEIDKNGKIKLSNSF